MAHQGAVAKQGFTGLIGVMMTRVAASTESEFLSLGIKAVNSEEV
jgi:hypothetical protein